jgi:hypothetical protein
MVLDHNRILVDAEFERGDGTWRKVRLCKGKDIGSA